MKFVFDRFMAWTVDHRGFTFLAVVMITVLAVIGHTRPDWVRQIFISPKPNVEQPAAKNNVAPRKAALKRDAPQQETQREAPQVDPVSLSGSDAVLVVQSPQFFTPAGAKAMRHVVDELEKIDYVRSILWMDRVPILNIFGLPEPLFPRSEASPERFAAAQEKAMKHPLVGGQLLAEDGKTMLLLVTFDMDYIRSNEQCTILLRQAAEKAAADFPDVPITFQVTGRMPAYITAMESHEANQLKYQLIGYGAIFIMAIILFRGIRAVLIVSLAPIVGVFWTLGFLKFFNLQDNPFNDVILPVLVSLVGLTDGVHLTVQIRKLRASGWTQRAAAKSGVQQVGFACMLTSLTTAIGLGSLALAHNVWVQDFGWCSVIGVTLMFVAVVTIIPLVCSTWLGSKIHLGHDKSLIDRNLTRIGELVEWVLKYPRTFSVFGIVATFVCIGISLTLRPDERRVNSLPEHSEAYQALHHMDEVLGGLEFARVDVHWNTEIGDASPEILEVISEVDALLHTEPLIGYPLSIKNLVESLPGDGDYGDRMMMLELLPPQLKRAFFTPEYGDAVVNFRVQDIGIAKFGPVFTRLESGLVAIAAKHPEFTLKLQGDAIWRWKNLYRIVVDLAASLGTASIIILIVLSLAYRSWRIGLISFFPNAFPLAVTGVWLVFAGYNLELVSVCAFTVCLGIAVDDTIHFLSRYEEERTKTDDRETAIRQAFTGVGVSLVMTTVVLVAGFSTVAFSDSRDHHIFATMGALTIGFALLGDLLILPALISWLGPKKSQ
jgi:uncharacterized protein